MSENDQKYPARDPLPGARSVGKTRPDERFEVTFVVRRGAEADFKSRIARIERGDRTAQIGHDAFRQTYASTDADMAAVRAFAQTHDLTVVQADPARRAVVVAGTAAQFRAALGVDFETFEHPGGTYRGRLGAVQLPAALEPVVEAVLGLDNRPQAKPHFRLTGAGGSATAHAAAAVSYNPPQVAGLYAFPPGTGGGQTIALIELGGGYRPADLATYFAKLGIAPAPAVSAVSVDNATNAPTGSGDGPDGEVMLDIEVAGSIAAGAKIVVYFAPNTDAGFLDAITTAVHDTANKPDIISISWGGPESSWDTATMTQFDEAFQSAATLGITVCVASGDNGSSDGVATGNHVDFPASSPHVLACGGTSLRASGSTITAETVWNDGTQGGASGGGVSTVFALPAWQAGCEGTAGSQRAPLAMRGVPDVAGDADPETGYNVIVDGAATQIGGTSAVAPLWASLIARCNSIIGANAGFLNPLLYANQGALRDITSGNNGAYEASPGWDAATGLGSPNGAAIVTLLKAAPRTATLV
jgi:kumamolisin